MAANWNQIDLKTKIAFKANLLSFLSNNSARANIDILKAVIQCLIQIIKFAWFDDPKFKEIISELQSFSTSSLNHWHIALIAYDTLINEMSYFNKGRNLSTNRRVSMNFRDIYSRGNSNLFIKISWNIVRQAWKSSGRSAATNDGNYITMY